MLRAAVALGKSPQEIENEYAWIDLPELLRIRNEIKAQEWFDQLEASAFPHIADEKVRKAIWERHRSRLPKPPPALPKSAEEQYQELLARMKAGG